MTHCPRLCPQGAVAIRVNVRHHSTSDRWKTKQLRTCAYHAWRHDDAIL